MSNSGLYILYTYEVKGDQIHIYLIVIYLLYIFACIIDVLHNVMVTEDSFEFDLKFNLIKLN